MDARKIGTIECPCCDSLYEVGSYPGSQQFFCKRALGHDGEHEAIVSWTSAEESNWRPASPTSSGSDK